MLRTPTVDKATSDGRRARFSLNAHCFSALKKSTTTFAFDKTPPGSTPGWQRNREEDREEEGGDLFF